MATSLALMAVCGMTLKGISWGAQNMKLQVQVMGVVRKIPGQCYQVLQNNLFVVST